MTNKAVAWIKHQQAMTPDKPFFAYFAPGATHAPHHVPKDWIARWKGKFDKGWDKMREETLARQIKLGVVPPGTPLAPKPEAIKDWDKLSADEKRLFARQAEVFAAFAEMTDYEIGRVINAIKDMGELDNTLILYIAGDNGASAEGGAIGMFNEMSYFNGVQEQLPDLLKLPGQVGWSRDLPSHGGRMGGCLECSVHVDQAGRLELRRNPQRDGRALAEGHQGEGRGPQPVPPRDRRCAHDPGSRQAS